MKPTSLLMTFLIMLIAMSSYAQVTGTFTDARDGKTYKTVTIGTQMWMAENLKATKYNDGTPIPLAKIDPEWPSNRASGYCWYDNDEAKYKNIYGALYNQFTVSSDKLCPIGWSVPGNEDWKILEEFLYNDNDEEDMQGGRLKEAGTNHWASPNAGATNSCGVYSIAGWSHDDSGLTAFPDNKANCFSVRCIKDK
jgi:uncharacterized protein (TIGR02145 family)